MTGLGSIDPFILLTVATILVLIIFILTIVQNFRRKPTIIGRTAIILLIIGLLFLLLLVFRGQELGVADWAQTLLMIGLVLVTAFYASSAEKQADASMKMAEEMKEQRVTASRPVVVQKAVHEKDIYEGSTKDYFSHFEAYNKGNGPAIEVEISLVDSDKRTSIDSHRKSFLGAGEPPIEFRPTSLAARRENSTCYLVCEYQSILSSGPRKMWYQTWLPFKPSKSSEKDKIYVVAGELEFKEATEKERIDAFSRRSKPQ